MLRQRDTGRILAVVARTDAMIATKPPVDRCNAGPARAGNSSQRRLLWPKRVADPVNSVTRITCDSDHVEAHRMVSELRFASNKQGRGAQDLLLFTHIDSRAGTAESRGCAVTDFDEYQAIAMQHDQVDFAAAAAEIPGHRLQAPVEQEAQCRLLCALSYS